MICDDCTFSGVYLNYTSALHLGVAAPQSSQLQPRQGGGTSDLQTGGVSRRRQSALGRGTANYAHDQY
eukprot:234158-Pleurochrysis_carterae.AAC.1